MIAIKEKKKKMNTLFPAYRNTNQCGIDHALFTYLSPLAIRHIPRHLIENKKGRLPRRPDPFQTGGKNTNTNQCLGVNRPPGLISVNRGERQLLYHLFICLCCSSPARPATGNLGRGPERGRAYARCGGGGGGGGRGQTAVPDATRS